MDCNCQGLTVRIMFIRHGFSCANMLKETGMLSNISKAFLYDPPLTNHAIRDITSVRNGVQKKLGRPDVVFASTLLRAQQTANFLFPDQTVFVAPYIKELGSTLDNKPNTPDIQKKIDLKSKQIYNSNSVVDGKELQKVDETWRTNYTFVMGRESSEACVRNSQVSWDEAQDVNYNKFIFWLEQVLPCMIKLNRVKVKDNTITVGVVGHSSFMAKYIETLEVGKKQKPNNVGIVELYFCLSQSNDGKYLFNKINQNCGCPGIQTLKTLSPNDRRKNCNGVVFSGFPLPKNLSRFSGDNCKILT